MLMEPHMQHATSSSGLAAFLDDVRRNNDALDAVTVFNAVRNLPYLSTGDRSLAGILSRRAGSCSSKHILLAALLQELDIRAQVELVLGDFATPFRNAKNIPPMLMEAAHTGIRDVHNIVRAEINGRRVILDATWHDAMKSFAMRVNHDWSGQGDTVVAVDVFQFLGVAADPAAAKASIIESWPEAEQRSRRQFLESVNDWVASVT
jgi:hypothetical protein